MEQYCYNIVDVEDKINFDSVKRSVKKIYMDKQIKDSFTSEEEFPFVFVLDVTQEKICINLTSKAKKNITRIEKIHSQLKKKHLKGIGYNLEKPQRTETQQCRWWDEGCMTRQKEKWRTLKHNGPYFTHIFEPYEPHNAPLIYNGVKYNLSPDEEKVANFYARRIISEEAGTVTVLWTQDKVFNNNFWGDFQEYLSPAHRKIMKNFNKLDFSLIVEKLAQKKEDNKNISARKKIEKKEMAAQKKQTYGFAVVNGFREPVGNFIVEQSSLFMGRGENPLRGKIKRDIDPSEVTINIGESAKIPSPPHGYSWKNVVHDHSGAWIAKWKDPLSREDKYVYLSAEGQFKGKSDLFKFEKARKLNHYIDVVREGYTKDINGRTKRDRQLGTVIYLIDKYGIRPGGEKDESETDTVGASTLRVEHVKLEEPNTVIFDFLGKDSIRYYKEINVSDDIFRNFVEFIRNKNLDSSLFDLISAADINSYLKTFDKDFSSKVFRTRLASSIMNDALKKSKLKKGASPAEKKKFFDKANLAVAEVLNHQRTVSTKAKETVKKYKKELEDLKKQLRDVKKQGKFFIEKSTKTLETKIEKKKDQIEAKEDTLSVAISTSRTNYIDPRIVVSWCIRNDLDLSKIYTATLQKKFKWVIDMVTEDWDYEKEPLIKEMKNLEPQQGKPSKPRPAAKKQTPVRSVRPEIGEQPSVRIVNYSEKSIAVLGNTMPIKEILKKIGGRYNSHLKINEQTVSGWIFSKKKREEVERALGITKTSAKKQIPEIKNNLAYSTGEFFNMLTNMSDMNVLAMSKKFYFDQDNYDRDDAIHKILCLWRFYSSNKYSLDDRSVAEYFSSAENAKCKNSRSDESGKMIIIPDRKIMNGRINTDFYCFSESEVNKIIRTRKNPLTKKKLTAGQIKDLENILDGKCENVGVEDFLSSVHKYFTTRFLALILS